MITPLAGQPLEEVPMRRRHALPFILALLVASTAHATPIVRYTWGTPAALVVDQPWAGPGLYTQSITVTGLSGLVSAFDVTIANGPFGARAWLALFSPFPLNPPTPDCLGGPGFEIDPVVPGATTIPGGTVTALVSSGPVSITTPVIVSTIRLHVDIVPPLVADPAGRYAIATLLFHHERSEAGTSGSLCGGADEPHCFALIAVSRVGGGVTTPLAQENGLLSWQGAGLRTADCLRLATPTHGSTWGELKVRYR
jgi:hypothetical protein